MNKVDVAFYQYLEADWWSEYHRQRAIALAATERLTSSVAELRKAVAEIGE